jgi:hypothetical protein
MCSAGAWFVTVTWTESDAVAPPGNAAVAVMVWLPGGSDAVIGLPARRTVLPRFQVTVGVPWPSSYVVARN